MRLEPHRLVFIDEAGTTTKMTRLRGRYSKGQHLRAKVPFGHRKIQTLSKAREAWMLFLPPYSSDLNPIEKAFSKLKARPRTRAIRAIDGLWQAIGDICHLYLPTECQNYFKTSGYA